MNKYIFLALSILLISCQNQDKKKAVGSSNQILAVDFDSLPTIDTTEIVFKDSTIVWIALNDFHKRLSGIWEVKTVEDLRLLTEELIELEASLEETQRPELFQTDAVVSRLILIRTYLNQLHAYIELDQDLTISIQQLLEAHRSLIHKIELIENNANAPKLSPNDLD